MWTSSRRSRSRASRPRPPATESEATFRTGSDSWYGKWTSRSYRASLISFTSHALRGSSWIAPVHPTLKRRARSATSEGTFGPLGGTPSTAAVRRHQAGKNTRHARAAGSDCGNRGPTYDTLSLSPRRFQSVPSWGSRCSSSLDLAVLAVPRGMFERHSGRERTSV